MTGNFRVLRPFFLVPGKVILIGEVIALNDVGIISELLGLGRIEAADEQTRGLLRTRPRVTWEAAPSADDAGSWPDGPWRRAG